MTTPTLHFPIGKSDFASVRQGNYYYVDKSLFIQEVLENSAEVLLIPRPRRFGKTLNLSMLRYFLEKLQVPTELANRSSHAPESQVLVQKQTRRKLFAGLQIESIPDAWVHFAKYPVIFLTFKDVKAWNWEPALEDILGVLSRLYRDHRYLVDSEVLHPEEKEYFHLILQRKATPAQAAQALVELTRYLSTYHEKKVVVLVDEYDTCLHEAYLHGYYEEAIKFFRNLLSGAFKDNSNLFKGVMTGILRIGRESLFSGLNNLAVYSLLRPEFATCFGFTEAEVQSLTEQMGHAELLPKIKSWYNGYLFGEQYEIYNPWSILNFLDSQNKRLEAYWVNISSNDLIQKLLFDSGLSTQTDVETLLRGGSIDKPLEENTVLRDLNENSIWSFLLFSGYLKATARYSKNRAPYVTLMIPNYEVETAFTSLTRAFFQTRLGRSRTVDSLIAALFAGHAEKVEEVLSRLMKVCLSFDDVPASITESQIQSKPKKNSTKRQEEAKSDPEAVYHAFVLGLLVNLQDEYEVRSNRESGYGQADLLLIPRTKGKPGVVMEFKILNKNKRPKAALQEAWQQIKDRQYKTELQERGADPIFEYAIAFSGKQAYVRGQERTS